MADFGDRDRSRRGDKRRKPRGAGPPRSERKDSRDYDDVPSAPSRPIILAKHSDETLHVGGSQLRGAATSPPVSQVRSVLTTSPSRRQPEKPVMVLRTRDGEPHRTLEHTAALPVIPVATAQGETPQPAYSVQRPAVPHTHLEGPGKFALPSEMSRCMKLIDDSNQWNENVHDLLLDHTDFLVVGVLGLQGSGKSTVMSLLAGNTEDDPTRSYVFAPQSREVRDDCGHQTNGIDVFVTSQRVILLDCQPLLSASILDQFIHHEKKLPPEYIMAENYAEMQSLQQTTFLMTVCNVILVVQDWFTDLSLLQFIQRAEMLKPSTPSSSHDTMSGQDDPHEYYPQIVFVQNKAERSDFSLETYRLMEQTLNTVFNNSRLKMKGSVNMSTGRQVSGLNPRFVQSDLNLFLLPYMDGTKPDFSDGVSSLLPEFRGYPSFSTLINSLRSQIYSLPREPLTQAHAALTEKNWGITGLNSCLQEAKYVDECQTRFHYAARTWDAIKKSQLLAEYNRLLP